jgi:putative sigma-54 modulation protein
MKINIQSLHFKSSEDLHEFIESRISKLGHFSERIISADVSLKLDHSDKLTNKVCELRLEIPGNDLFAKSQCKTFEEAISESADAIQVQLIKQKTKDSNHKGL